MFAARHLAALLACKHKVVAVVTQPDQPGKRGKRRVPGPVKQLATVHDLPLLQPRRLRASSLEGVTADIMVVVAYGQILKPEVLQWPPRGCINVHASLLPRWRGAAPIQRAILAGDSVSGVCIMQMDEGLDTGDVLCRREVTITPDDTAGTLTDKLAEAGGAALIETLDAIEQGAAAATRQPAKGITWANKVDKSEARLDWTQRASQLSRCVRAFNPDPGAYAFISGMRVKVWQARAIHVPAPSAPGEAPPGQIVASTRQGIDVVCGEGQLRLERVQLPVGKGKVVGAADLINARRTEFAVGQRFDGELPSHA